MEHLLLRKQLDLPVNVLDHAFYHARTLYVHQLYGLHLTEEQI